MSVYRAVCALSTASVVVGAGCLEAPGPFAPRDVGENGEDTDVVDEGNVGLVLLEDEYSRQVRGAEFEVGFEAGTAWGLSSLRVVTAGKPSAEIFYRGDEADERWAGALLYDPNHGDNIVHASWESEGNATAPVERGPALVHMQHSWAAENSEYTGITDVVVHADGRIHMHHRTQLTGEDVIGGWLLSYFSFDLNVMEHVGLELGDERDVPSTPPITPDSFDFLFREETSVGRHPTFFCAYGHTGDAMTPVAVGVAPLSSTPSALSRITEGSENANVSHSVRMQFDWMRDTVSPGEYRGSFLMVAMPESDCRGRVSAILDHGIRPPSLQITRGGELLRDDPRDEAGDGYIEGLGYYHVRLLGNQIAEELRRLTFSFSTRSNGATLRLDAAEPFTNLDNLQVLRENDPLVRGVDYVAQLSEGGGRVFIVFLRAVLSDSSYEITW